MKENKQTAFSVFFTQLHKLLPAGMLFSVLAVIFMTLTIGLSAILAQSTGIKGFNSIFIWALGLIPTTICYSGLVKVVRKYAVEKEFVPVFPLYLRTVGDNIKGFLLLGIFVYLISCCSFYSLLFYFSMLRANRAFGIALTAYSFFTLMMIVMLFYLPLLTVTYELRYRDIFKNAVYLAFKKPVKNLLTFLMSAALIGAVFPMLITYIEIAMVSKGVIENVGDFVDPIVEEEPIEIHTVNTEDDYIFVNGRMIKNPNKNK
ncbi:MAG: hypothetical protein II698_01495 [Ruminococcus sp.]|nr:hypothetical protein [Ruminococcus sp.]